MAIQQLMKFRDYKQDKLDKRKSELVEFRRVVANLEDQVSQCEKDLAKIDELLREELFIRFCNTPNLFASIV